MQSSADPRAAVFLKQFDRGPVSRSRRGNTLLVSLDHTTADLMVDLEDEVRSAPVRVHNLADGQMLEFQVRLAPGGFFNGLWGTADRPWPRRWALSAEEVMVAARGALQFEPEAGPDDPELLAAVLGTSARRISSASWRLPASGERLNEVEAREGQPIPGGVRDLLLLADGLTAGTTTVLGARDLYTLEVTPGRAVWLVGVDVDGTHFVCDGNGVVAFADGLADAQSDRPSASSYLGWVRQLIESPMPG